jgi:hypothetical protein
MPMPMAACNQIIGYLDALLDPTAYDDYRPNGLQVPGTDEIQTVVTGVSANAELFTRAREAGCTSSPPANCGAETFGVRAPGERLAERFGIRHVFVDVPNPIQVTRRAALAVRPRRRAL